MIIQLTFKETEFYKLPILNHLRKKCIHMSEEIFF